MKNILYVFIIITGVVIFACEPDRSLIPNTHDGRVPEVVNFNITKDTTKSSPTATTKYVLKLNWGYDTLKYGFTPNLKNWEVYRVVANDTLTFKFQLQKFVQVPFYADSTVSIQPAGRDSVVILYRVIPIGNVVDNIQFTGQPSDIVRVVVFKK